MKTNATEMDYKKEYEAMVQRARELHEGGNALTKQQMEIVCPELAESKDARVNEEIRNFLIDMECKREWIAYLEKQKEQKLVTFEEPCNSDEYEVVEIGNATCLRRKEQKSAEWSEEDKRKLNMLYSIVSQAADAHAFFTTTRLISDKDAIELHDFLKSLHPQLKQEWSYEDEKNKTLACDLLINGVEADRRYPSLITWLESLPMGCPKKTE